MRLPISFASMIAILFAIALAASLSVAAPTAYAQDDRLQAGTITRAEPTGTTVEPTAVQAQNIEYTTVAKVKLNKKTATIKNNKKLRLKATLVPKNKKLPIADRTITWTVSNPKVASVSADGVVQGIKSGTVKVTARAANGKKATAKVKVVVNKKKMAKKIPVLTYHRIASNSAKNRFYRESSLVISASSFNRQMSWLKKNGYKTISTEQFAAWRVDGAYLPKKSVLITIDDGFYETYHVAYPILKKYNLKATSFVIGAHVKKKTKKYDPGSSADRYLGWDVINEVRATYPNLEFQSHTYNMHHRGGGGNGVARSWSLARIKADFEKNKKFGFTTIAYPFGHTSANLLAVVKADPTMRVGFGYMMTKPATRTSSRYNIPRFKMMGNASLSEFKSIVQTAG